MKNLFIIITAVALCFAAAITADEVPLCAGKNINVGTVTTVNTDDVLYVTYTITESNWILVETHLAVENDPADIPQTVKNKMSSGDFPIMPKKIGRKLLWDKKVVDKFLDKLKEVDC